MVKNLRFLLLSMFIMLGYSAYAEDIIWQEDFSTFAKDDVPTGGDYQYACENGGGTTKIYTEKIAGGESPELLVAKSGGSFSAKIVLNGKSGDMFLAFKSNQRISALCDGNYISHSINTGNDYIYDFTVPAGTNEITITFKMEGTKNARLDNIKLYQGTAKKPAGLSWGKASTNLTIGQEVTLVLSNENNLPVVYSSSDETVATISQNGVISLIAVGKTTLSAAFDGNDEYEAQTVSINVTVKDASGTPTDSTHVTPIDSTQVGPTPQPVGDTLTVTKALEIIDQLANGAKTTDKYYVQGSVGVITEISTKYGNATFTLVEGEKSLTIYRAKLAGGKSITNAELFEDGDVLMVYGQLQKYQAKDSTISPQMAQYGEIMSINGNPVEEQQPVPVDSTTTEIKQVTIAEFNAAAESNDVWYQLTGTVKNLNDGDRYGNFDIEDATGSVYVYGLLSEKGGAKAKFQELAAEKGIVNGCKLTLIGTRGSFKDKIEVMNAYFVSVEGGDTTIVEPTVQEVTVAQAIAIVSSLEAGMTSTDEYIIKGYVVSEPVWKPYTDKNTGEVKNYNVTFNMNDQKNDTVRALYVYNPMDFSGNYFAQEYENLKNGSEVVLQGKLQNYKDKNNNITLELVKAHFISIDGLTGIIEVKADKQQGAIYTISGQRVIEAKRGLYIINGRKYLLK